MTFKTKQSQLDISTESELQALVDLTLQKREQFILEKAPGHSLSAATPGSEGVILELHRGKKWDGWISSARAPESARELFIQYYREPISPSGEIEKVGEWFEVGAFPPFVHLLVFGIILTAIVWGLFL